MGTVYILKNQHNFYLDKSGEWVNGENSKSLYRTEHKDEAINQKVEFSVKNFELRIEVAEVEKGNAGNLLVEVLAEAPIEEEATAPQEESAFPTEEDLQEDLLTADNTDKPTDTAEETSIDLLADTADEAAISRSPNV